MGRHEKASGFMLQNGIFTFGNTFCIGPALYAAVFLAIFFIICYNVSGAWICAGAARSSVGGAPPFWEELHTSCSPPAS